MKEILFRGKGRKIEGWIYGAYMGCTTDDGYIACQDNGRPRWTNHPVDNKTVGQYTGIKDRNGTKIFEGDIVRIDEDVKVTFGVGDGEVKYGWGGFYVNKFGLLNSLNALSSFNIKNGLRGEVIGNIHDNPELLKGE